MPIQTLMKTPPEVGEVLAVAEGIWWVRLPLPFALNHINVWLLEDGDGYTLVDTGVYLQDVRDAWEKIERDFLQGRPIVRVLLTHCHPDHIGMAAHLAAHHQAPVWMTLGEYAYARILSANMPGVDRDSMLAFYGSHGLVEQSAEAAGKARGGLFAKLVPTAPLAYRRIIEGDVIQIGKHSWRVWTGHGHSPEHASLISESSGWMISGDMLWPHISTNVSVHASEPDGNPLKLFLASVERMLQIDDALKVLPSHGLPFSGIHYRCQQLLDHHAERLSVLLTALTEPKSAREIIATLFKRELDGHQLTFAMGEAIAHLHYLRDEGKVQQTKGDDGVWRFVALSP
jgi:glyoxylase-like metal-dependent hydrolase (beta-lactamase superfamily II)